MKKKSVRIILMDDSFKKEIIAGPHGYIYTIFGLEVSLAGLPGPKPGAR